MKRSIGFSRPGCGHETDQLSITELSFILNDLTPLFGKVPNFILPSPEIIFIVSVLLKISWN